VAAINVNEVRVAELGVSLEYADLAALWPKR
jgi:hypothetical protein